MGKCSVKADRESIKRACEPALSVQATNDDSDDPLSEIQPWSNIEDTLENLFMSVATR